MDANYVTATAEEAGLFGWQYNRANFQFDQTMRWQRYLLGRKMAVAQAGMFRQDVTDLTGVTIGKLKIYAPIMAIAASTCCQIYVQGRFGLGRPSPPTFATSMYYQCFGIALVFFLAGIWLAFHSALRAQIAAVQLRTRIVRLPVPSQKQLDSARQLLSNYEEQTLWDMFRLPFVVPHPSPTPSAMDSEPAARKGTQATYYDAGLPGLGARLTGRERKAKMDSTHGRGFDDMLRVPAVPGATEGVPAWIAKEMDKRVMYPNDSPSAGFGEGPLAPFAHFELVRQCQKEWWAAEAYTRVCFLFGMLHFAQAVGYWLVSHVIAEQMWIWAGIMCSGTLMAAVWLMFRIDVLPELGGSLPVEAGGPFVTAIGLALGYTADLGDPRVIDVTRAIGIIVVVMQILWTYRLYSVARPSCMRTAPEKAVEDGGCRFNESAACELPTWLPAAMQAVSYLVAAPKSAEQVQQEKTKDKKDKDEDPLLSVDMSPWHIVRSMLTVIVVSWAVILAGRIVESIIGHRVTLSLPGTAPWTRVGQWNSWETGPVTSKAFAHVTPVTGHYHWSKGWGPNGQQRKWPVGLFGAHPEADSWWAEEEGPAPLIGAAGIGPNTWTQGVLAYGQEEPKAPVKALKKSVGQRRLRRVTSLVVRPVVPAAIEWPVLLEPSFVVCGPMHGEVLALNEVGMGALVSKKVASGRAKGVATSVTFEGLFQVGLLQGLSWGRNSSLLASTLSGISARCKASPASSSWRCEALDLPRLPASSLPTLILEGHEGAFGAVVAFPGAKVKFFQLEESEDGVSWAVTEEVLLPFDTASIEQVPEVVSLTASDGTLLVATNTGATFKYELRDNLPAAPPAHEAPTAGARFTWRSACSQQDGSIIRLASSWKRSDGNALVYHPTLLL